MSKTSEHLSEHEIERYLRRAMTPTQMLAADDHLAVCETCYGRIQLKEDWGRALASVESAFEEVLAAPAHPDYERLVAYMDGDLSRAERDAMDSHFQTCSQCEQELSELRAVQAPLAAGPDRRTRLTWARLWAGVVAFWKTPAFRISVPAAGALAALVLLAWLTTSPLRNNTQERAEGNRRHEKDVARQERQTTGPAETEDIAITLNDGGGRLVMDKQGRLQGLASPDHQDAVIAVLLAQRVPPPVVLRDLTGKPATLLGSAQKLSSFRLIGPVASVVLDDRPTFRWHPLKGAEGYDIAIYDVSLRLIAAERSIATTVWRAPQPLPRGRTYTWQVRAAFEGKEVVAPPATAPEAKFKILDQAHADQLNRLQQAYSGSHLMLGVVYAEAGLLEETEREFQALSDANPHSEVAKNLLRSVKALRR